MRPLIGVTATVDQARWQVWEDEIVHIEAAYVHSLRAVGARVVLLPPGAVDGAVLDVLDGLVVAGGPDIAPGMYGAEPDAMTVSVRHEQDSSEAVLVRGAEERRMPVLAICRGMQLLCALHGGRLHQHLPDVPAHRVHGAWKGAFTDHRVDLTSGSRLAKILGETLTVNSGHHQGVADAGSLTVTGYSPDGLIEAVEHPDHDMVVGVQWHPEMVGQPALFTALVDAALDRHSRMASGPRTST
jgi:putative glutamine amidotransferase